MVEKDFTNREITLMFSHIKEKLEAIEAQTIKTNGRVTNLESRYSGLVGKISVYTTIGAAVIVTAVEKLLK